MDIDDLLDEVESKFVKNKSKPSAPKPPTKVIPKRSHLEDAIDDLLDLDIQDGPKVNKTTQKSMSKASLSESCSKTEPKRCFPVYLGGSEESMGRATSINKYACNELRCTACDFRVCTFDNMAWSKDTDYLFLRNNTPDFDKLKSKLKRKKGCRAYCCQCQWRNITELVELRDQELKWVCGKHKES